MRANNVEVSFLFKMAVHRGITCLKIFTINLSIENIQRLISTCYIGTWKMCGLRQIYSLYQPIVWLHIFIIEKNITHHSYWQTWLLFAPAPLRKHICAAAVGMHNLAVWVWDVIQAPGLRAPVFFLLAPQDGLIDHTNCTVANPASFCLWDGH